MNVALAAGTFAVIIPAELPDKTFISAIVLSSKHAAFPVWLGTAAGLVVQAAIGVAAGRLLALLPHRTVEVIVAGLFLLGAAYLLFVPERRGAEKGARVADRGDDAAAKTHAEGGKGVGDELTGGEGTIGELAGGVGGCAPRPRPDGDEDEDDEPTAVRVRSPARIALMSFGIVTLAEFGDLTQVIVANLTARSGDPWSVFAGAAVAFVLVSAVGVAAGRTLTRYVPLALVRRLSGIALAGLGAWSLASAFGA